MPLQRSTGERATEPCEVTPLSATPSTARASGLSSPALTNTFSCVGNGRMKSRLSETCTCVRCVTCENVERSAVLRYSQMHRPTTRSAC